MKIEKDKLIDFDDIHQFAQWYWERNKHQILDQDIEDYVKSINPRNETDGHRRLEDNKDKKKICPKCGCNKFIEFGFYKYCSNIDCRHPFTN